MTCADDAIDDDRLRATLLRSALAMVDEPSEAHALVAKVLRDAGEGGAQAAPGEADLFRLLRRAYHSVERSHSRRRIRDATVTTLAVQQARSTTGQDS